jgi:hypothetical protein
VFPKRTHPAIAGDETVLPGCLFAKHSPAWRGSDENPAIQKHDAISTTCTHFDAKTARLNVSVTLFGNQRLIIF